MLLSKALSLLPSKTDKSDTQLLGEPIRGGTVPFPVASWIETSRRCRGWEPDTSAEDGPGASELPSVVDGAPELFLLDPPACDRFVVLRLGAFDPWMT